MTDQPKCPKCQAQDLRVVHRWVGCTSCGWQAIVYDPEIIALALQKHEGEKGKEETRPETEQPTGEGRDWHSRYVALMRAVLHFALHAPGFDMTSVAGRAWARVTENVDASLIAGQPNALGCDPVHCSPAPPLPAPLTPEERFCAVVIRDGIRATSATSVAIAVTSATNEFGAARWKSLLDRLNAEEGR